MLEHPLSGGSIVFSAESISSSGHPFPLTLPSPRRRGRYIGRAKTNCGASTFPATGQAPSPLGRGQGEGELGSRRFHGRRISVAAYYVDRWPIPHDTQEGK